MEAHPGEAVKNIVAGHAAVGRPGHGVRRRVVRDDLDRQGRQSHQRDGRLQARGRAVRPVAGRAARRAASSPCASATCSIRPAAWCSSSASRSPPAGPSPSPIPTCERYFMTIPEAARLVIQAGAIGQGGQILAARHGRAGPHRRPGRRHDPPFRPARGRGHRDRVHRPAARREALRGAARRRRNATCPPAIRKSWSPTTSGATPR